MIGRSGAPTKKRKNGGYFNASVIKLLTGKT